MDISLYPRFAKQSIDSALKDTPVVLVTGPRQCGKTTLVRQFMSSERTYLTLDDASTLAAAQNDPTGFVRELKSAIIDEIQRAPDLLRAIKKAVDDNRTPGRFLLTGSANILTVPRVSESLAGRMEIVQLYPLSRAEIRATPSRFIDNAFAGNVVPPDDVLLGDDLVNIVLTGGYPEMLRRSQPARQQAWVRDYVTTLIERDVRDIAEIEKLDLMPTLLQILAHHASQLTNFTQIGGQTGLDDKTVKKYIAVFEQLFLVHRLQPWFHNPLNRLVKTPKLHFLDSGLLAAMTGVTLERIGNDRGLFGPLLETFVYAEVAKQTALSSQVRALAHYRDKAQHEVDIVCESFSGHVVGIEVKARATVRGNDFDGLRKLFQLEGERFALGMVLYDGDQVLPFGAGFWAVPISSLWG